MADIQKMDRTWLCSVLFMDIVNYSSQSVDMQMKWKTRFNSYLGDAIREVPESERVILDTGDGAAVCFLGSPEAAMFAAFDLWRSFVQDEHEQQPGLHVRIGINLGPVRLLKDINGALNAIGDGINDGQRVMSFAPDNQILVSQSYFEVVSRLSDDYKTLFRFKGVETDKHIREHTVYSLLPPGAAKSFAQAAGADATWTYQQRPAISEPTRTPVGPEARLPKTQGPGRKRVPLVVGGALIILVAAFITWRFAGIGGSKPTATTHLPEVTKPTSQQPAPQVTTPSASSGIPGQSLATSASKHAAHSAAGSESRADTLATSIPADDDALPTVAPAQYNATNAAKGAYNEGMRLMDQKEPAEAMRQFDSAIRADPRFVLAYLGRAKAHRLLRHYETGIDDCNRVIKIQPDEPQAYFCRALGEKYLMQYDLAVRDYTEALRLHPNYAPVYEMRGEANLNLQQYGRALDDLNRAIMLKPNNAPSYVRRGQVYAALKQYGKAIQDYDEAILLQPHYHRAYELRAHARGIVGDRAGAAADQRYAQEPKQD